MFDFSIWRKIGTLSLTSSLVASALGAWILFGPSSAATWGGIGSVIGYSLGTAFPMIALIYLGIFSTGIAWLLRFYILKHNGLVFQAQVAYLIPIFGVILGFLFLNEAITSKVIISLIAVIIGIYIVKKGNKIKLP